MQSTVHLFNTALARLGGEQLPQNISPQEDNAVGQLCEHLFPQVLDLTLAAHHWSFALRRVALASVPDTQPANDEYRLAFQMPSDCVKPVRLEGAPAYVIEGTTIRTNQEKPVLVYVRRVTDPKLWPPSFADALAWGLAGELASARVNDGQKQNWCYQNYKIALADAIVRDLADQNPRRPRSAWQAARYGMTGGRW
ncbi:MAG: hypothetical protein LBS65_09010 [Desulfovibrio sp.]|jgi:hypothetical protein|nr:hypothetical protein [Desulfovibrio sp.]